MRWREIWHRWKQITDVFLPPSTLCNHIIPFTASLLYRGIEEDSTWLCWKKAYFFPLQQTVCQMPACRRSLPRVVGCLVCVSQRKAFTDLINLENYIEQEGGEGWWGKDYELNFISHDSSPALSLPLSHSHSLSLSETSILIFEILVIHVWNILEDKHSLHPHPQTSTAMPVHFSEEKKNCVTGRILKGWVC